MRTDYWHEFQAKFLWHVEDQGIRDAYIKPRSPQINGKVERSHRMDQEEFYQLFTYKDDVDLEEKLAHWERFYKLSRPHGTANRKAPYEALREKLQVNQGMSHQIVQITMDRWIALRFVTAAISSHPNKD